MANPGMTKSLVAEAVVLPYRVVKFGAADGQVIQSAAATDALIGVADNLGQNTAGSRVDVIMGDIAEAEAGAAITRGAILTSDSVGRVIPAAPAAGVNNRIIGMALVAAGAAGEIININVRLGVMQG